MPYLLFVFICPAPVGFVVLFPWFHRFSIGLTPPAAFCILAPAKSGMSSILNQHVLVLNRLWQAVNICTARRALTLLFQGHAQAVLNRPDGSFQTFGFSEWHDLSQQEPDSESIRTVSFRIRIPRVILLMVYDHLPK